MCVMYTWNNIVGFCYVKRDCAIMRNVCVCFTNFDIGFSEAATFVESNVKRVFHWRQFFSKEIIINVKMKSPPPTSIVDDCDDIFGPPRTYATGFCPPKNRPTMISAKYRQKEERRKVLKISVNKLRKIEDPEVSLCRSVLINNTMKRLQQEARDEKIQKQQLNYPRCYDNDNFLNLKSEFIKNELKVNCDNAPFDDEVVRDFGANDDKLMDSFKEEFDNDFDAKMAEEMDTALSRVEEDLSNYTSETTTFTTSATNTESTTTTTDTITPSDRFQSRKRSLDDMEDCDVQDVLSQLYMPPTPRMLTNIDDDDEDVNVVDDEPVPKRPKLDFTELIEDTPVNSVVDDEPFVPTPSFPSDDSSTLLDGIDLDIGPAISSSIGQQPVGRATAKCTVDDLVRVSDSTFMNNNLPSIVTTSSENMANISASSSIDNFGMSTAASSRLRYHQSLDAMDTNSSSSSNSSSSAYSCGQASMFSELSSNVFLSLVTSLET